MRIRPRLLLTFALISTLPILLIVLIGFIISLKDQENVVRSDLETQFAATVRAYEEALNERDKELLALRTSPSLVAYLDSPKVQTGSTKTGLATEPTIGSTAADDQATHVKEVASTLVVTQPSYVSIAGFGPDRQIRFVAQSARGDQPVVFRNEGFLESEPQPDERMWKADADEIVCDVKTEAATGLMRRCSIAVAGTNTHRGTLLSVVSVERLFANAASVAELPAGAEKSSLVNIIVLDSEGKIIYHTNDAMKHQVVKSAIPYFASVAQPMTAGQSGAQTYRSALGDEWLAIYGPLNNRKTDGEFAGTLSLAVSRNVSLATHSLKRTAWLAVLPAVVIGLGTAALLTFFYERQTRSIEHVTERVAAIAKGKLDLRVEARSGDDIRPLADGVNLMTEQLRAQFAREAETRQVESFVRLSAMLTHDLKNAIGGLSLLVINMEQHFDNEAFRADAMKSLTGATQKLRALVERLNNPVTTLSGEFKKPEAVDLLPLLKRVVADTAEPMLGDSRLQLNLPESLVARIDSERIEKVIENLVLNALEAMATKPGLLTISAGQEDSQHVYIAVADTGVGMSDRFMEERLFHAFSTTKKNGMGLGLYTCREVVNANGGTIEVHSKQGVGTRFRIVLPSPPSDELPKNL